eukprot:1877152-Pleurochrysis_carterae.AAC.6
MKSSGGTSNWRPNLRCGAVAAMRVRRVTPVIDGGGFPRLQLVFPVLLNVLDVARGRTEVVAPCLVPRNSNYVLALCKPFIDERTQRFWDRSL